MPSNRELKDEAEALGKELGVSVETDGLPNAKLVELVKSLYDQLEARDGDVVPETEPPPVIEPEPQPQATVAAPAHPKPASAPRFPYTVAPRCSIVGPRGVLGPGKEILLRDFGPDPVAAQREIDRHVAAGRILKR